VAFVAHVILRSVITAGSDPLAVARAPSWVPLNALGLSGALLVLLGLPAILPGLVEIGGRASTIGLILLASAWAFFGFFLSLYGLLILPWLAERAPFLVAPGARLPLTFVAAFAIGLLSWLAGAVLFAVPFIRRRAAPAWIGYLVLASAVALVVGNLVIAPNGPVSNLALNLLSNVGPVLLLAAFGYLGFRLWSDASESGLPNAGLRSPGRDE
jgi:hypothetical protein